MGKRLVGVSLLLVLMVGVGVPAFAVEGEGPPVREELPTIDDIGQDNEVAQQFFPEGYEQPTVFPPILFGLLVAGLVIAMALLLLFLRWQPKFARDRQKQARR